MQHPQYSPDGRFWWNGYQWVPVGLPPPPWAPSKSPALYVLASVFIPGLGSLLLRRWRWGVAILGTTVAVWIAFFVVFALSFSDFATQVQACTPTCPAGHFPFPGHIFLAMAIAWPVWLVAWIVGIIDAIRGTDAWNRAHGLPE